VGGGLILGYLDSVGLELVFYIKMSAHVLVTKLMRHDVANLIYFKVLGQLQETLHWQLPAQLSLRSNPIQLYKR
jgi:hypothetical protein